MFIRCTTIKSKKNGDSYKTYRLVESVRDGEKVKQKTLLNLGKYFDVPQSDWANLSARIDELVTGHNPLFTTELTKDLESAAQRYASQIIAAQSSTVETQKIEQFESISTDTLTLLRPRQVGIEQIALHTCNQLEFQNKLRDLGFNQPQIAAAIGNIIARMAFPASERATLNWLQKTSGLGEMIDYDFEKLKKDRLYQASDLLWKNKKAIESHLYQSEKDLLNFEDTITLYDLTNTFFEGTAKENPKAKYGRSKEKRSDCPLVTLGLVLDDSGFPRKSEVFSGNASEPETLKSMLEGLSGESKKTVILDAGIASEENIDWLNEHGYFYIVVSRKRKKEFDVKLASIIKEKDGERVRVQRKVNEETGEIELYCHSELKEKKERAMHESSKNKFIDAIEKLSDGLKKKGTTKRYDKILEKVGRLKQQYSRSSQHYEIEVISDEEKKLATSINYQKKEKPNSKASHPGVYCLRTNIKTMCDEELWKTYTMLTDLESVFRSLKSELGMRPVFHHKEKRVSGHIFITLIAYHLVQTIRYQLKRENISDSWQTIRQKMGNQQKITVVLKREDGKTIHIRKATQPEPHQKEILDALSISCLSKISKKTVK
jgi:transposase